MYCKFSGDCYSERIFFEMASRLLDGSYAKNTVDFLSSDSPLVVHVLRVCVMTIERVYSYYTIHTDTSLCVCEYISLLRYVLSVCLDKQQMLMF